MSATLSLPAGTADRVAEMLYPVESEWAADPSGWTTDGPLREFLWSKQREIMASVAEHRYTAVRSAHSTGKSFSSSRLAAWWIQCHAQGEAFVVSTAPSQTQVEAILWREIGRAHRKGELTGRITYGSTPAWKIGNEMVGYGRKPQDLSSKEEAMAAFQGIHARYVLILIDEACGVPKWLFDAVDTLATNEHARVLAIGNPDDASSHFEKVCRPGSGWNPIKISAFDTPAYTGEEVPESLLELLVSEQWVEERKKRWGEGSPLYVSKVLGEFPEVSDDTLIQPGVMRACQELDLGERGKGQYGWDIARFGCHDDQTEILTDGGWLAFEDLTGDEKVLSRQESGETTWEPITEVHRYRHTGPMALYDGEKLNFCVTENHRMLMASQWQGTNRRVGPRRWQLRRWDECPAEFIVPRDVQWEGVDPGSFAFESRFGMPHGGERLKSWEFSAEDWFAFLGWFISEGNVYHEKRDGGRRRVLISQGLTHMPTIRALLERMGIKHRLTSTGNQVEFTIRAIADHLDAECRSGAAHKRIPRYVLDATPDLLDAFLDAYCDGDGWRRDGRRLGYCTSSIAIADGLQEMLVKLGRAGTLSRTNVAGSVATIEGRTITRRSDGHSITECLRVRPATINKKRARLVDYDGYVYCVSTPYHTILTRRNGCVLWAGNSDETVGYRNRGGTIRLVYSGFKQDTMTTAGHIFKEVERHKGACPAYVDVIGVGSGVVDRLHEQRVSVVPFNAAERAFEPTKFINRRAEVYWHFREDCEAGLIDLPETGEDDDLIAQLGAIHWKVDSRGRIQIESKDDMKKRGLPSPDRADAAVMSAIRGVKFNLPSSTEKETRMKSKTITGDLMKREL